MDDYLQRSMRARVSTERAIDVPLNPARTFASALGQHGVLLKREGTSSRSYSTRPRRGAYETAWSTSLPVS